jgi:hypothetical protein
MRFLPIKTQQVSAKMIASPNFGQSARSRTDKPAGTKRSFSTAPAYEAITDHDLFVFRDLLMYIRLLISIHKSTKTYITRRLCHTEDKQFSISKG